MPQVAVTVPAHGSPPLWASVAELVLCEEEVLSATGARYCSSTRQPLVNVNTVYDQVILQLLGND